ncbi:outer membrane protein assembly factor BamD [Saccharicrinis fermentans]|uniref:PEP-CTERM system TPR-repeat lipoprotein n=1 Tax=Saccharicrinis fermentans DSM 9555 = JCM 21142 TaxID=869213 RepID=W7YIC3_9BACT|nr:hypothetical protein [Saccharicrinis fermentans]GAF02299.1 hypothetical protein JCM21142_3931 [Saccharicrinis fermentans DSM 9555 = JCM 21142]
MRLIKGFIAVSILLGVVYSCSPLKKIESGKSVAMASYAEHNYLQAYEQLTALITSYQSAKLKVPVDILLKTADCAAQLKKYDVASDYFSQSLADSITMTGVKGYIENSKAGGNIDILASALNQYAIFLNENGEGRYLAKELFATALRTNDQESILKVYPDLEKPNEEESMAYLLALEKANKNKEALTFCNHLIKENPDYNRAKEWKAIYYYNLAEEGYKREMAKYNKKQKLYSLRLSKT